MAGLIDTFKSLKDGYKARVSDIASPESRFANPGGRPIGVVESLIDKDLTPAKRRVRVKKKGGGAGMRNAARRVLVKRFRR